MQRSLIIIAAIIAASLLAGCRNEEQHRFVSGNGTYMGGGNTGLTPKQVAALRNRVMLQATSNASASSRESMAEPGPAEAHRPKGQPSASPDALAQRLRQVEQGGH